MSSEWLDIQSFISDQETLRAINDLAMALHVSLAGKEDSDRALRGEKAKGYLQRFLADLNLVLQSHLEEAVVTGVDPRMEELAESFEMVKRDASRDRSVLLTFGPEAAVRLMSAETPPEKRELLKALTELRELITHHQQSSNMAIFEDF